MKTENSKHDIKLVLLRFVSIYLSAILGSLAGFLGSAYFPVALTVTFKINKVSNFEYLPLIFGFLEFLLASVLFGQIVSRNFSLLKVVLFMANDDQKMSIKHLAIIFVLGLLAGVTIQSILYLLLLFYL